MKIVALIEDDLGHRHLIASRSPDLVRRELSVKTGTAVLLWCAVPPESVGASAIVVQALERLGAAGPEALAVLSTDRIIKVLMYLCITEPKRKARSRRLQRFGRDIGHWLRPTRWEQSGAPPRKSLGI